MFYNCLALLMAIAPIASLSASEAPSSTHRSQSIQTADLKSWYDQKKEMVVLDARTKPHFDGTLLPQARWLPADASDEEIQAAIPAKNSLVVVYCAGSGCPASGRLYDKLVATGYTQVYEYPEGLREWVQKGYPVTKN